MLPSYYGRSSILLVSFKGSATRAVATSGKVVTLNLEICRNQHSTSPPPPTQSSLDSSKNIKSVTRILNPNVVEVFQSNVNWFNNQYERVFGISEVRDIQTKVLEAERDFVSITQQRKMCQEQIENFKEQIKKIRDKLDVTPRQSDNYLRLITEEHKLLREQLALDVQLDQLKENEQLSLDNMSKLLRQSHELERLRQERAKYWQIISISLSLAGSLVALIAQRSRSQKSVINRLNSIDTQLLELDELAKTTGKHYDVIVSRIDKLDARLEEIRSILASDRRPAKIQKLEPAVSSTSWGSWLVSWIPGTTLLKSLGGYLFQ